MTLKTILPPLIVLLCIYTCTAQMITAPASKQITSPSVFKQSKVFGISNDADQVLTLDNVPDPGDVIFVMMRNANSSTLTTYTGFTLLGSVSSSLYVLVREADGTDTGIYTFTWSGLVNNFGGHCMVAGSGSLAGYTNFSLTSYTNQLVVNAPSIDLQNNSIVLLYFTTTGSVNGATASVVTTGYTLELTSGFNNQSHYKFIPNVTTESATITFSPGTGPATTRVAQIEILGVN